MTIKILQIFVRFPAYNLSVEYSSVVCTIGCYRSLISFIKLTEYQYGLRKYQSNRDAFVEYTEKVYHSLNNKNYHVSVLIYLKKAFDFFSHKVLVDELAFYGFRGIPNKLIKITCLTELNMYS